MSDDTFDLFENDEVGGTDAGWDDTDELEDLAPGPKSVERAPKVWSVYQVNKAVKGLLDSSVEPLWVGGEIGSWTRSRLGHCYFTLKDDRAQIGGVMFAGDSAKLPADPDVGTKVRVYGDLTIYEQRGQFQVIAQKLEAEGTDGLWSKAFEALKQKLELEGLLGIERKRRLPAYPGCIGVVTSPTGAALHDITSVLRRRAPWTRVVLSGSRVQGEGASADVAAALRRLAATGLADVIIVGRGGGSLADLWAFNEEPLARAIADCPVPVISAVGHEVDVTISDLVADVRAPTPSAAAETVVPDGAALLVDLRRSPERLGRALRRTAARPGVEVAQRMGRLHHAIERRLVPARQSLDLGGDRLERGTNDLIQMRTTTLQGLAGRLEALSPLSTLARGYSVARTGDGRVLRVVEDFSPGTPFQLRVSGGTIDAETLSTHNNDDA